MMFNMKGDLWLVILSVKGIRGMSMVYITSSNGLDITKLAGTRMVYS